MSSHTHPAERGYDHIALYYANDDELLDASVPFLTEGVDRDEATMIALDGHRADLVLAELPHPERVTILRTDAQYIRPAVAIKSYCDMFANLVEGGASAIRVVGEIPYSALTRDWDVWSRYEAAVNYAYDHFPVRSMCAYDTRTTPTAVLRDVAQTHSLVAAGGVQKPNPDYVEPPSFLGRPAPLVPHPLQRRPPTVELTDPTPGEARHVVSAACAGALPSGDLGDLVVSVSEIITNAIRHGSPPATLCLWAGARQVVVAIHDRGPGPADPFAGLVATPGPEGGGYGLWIAHQLCHHVTMTRTDTGFTVRLTMGHHS
ncbi:sensor histidine kinase [Actinokineospora auranticolor]|uniref:Anti-sigma regulatory factor (Ser/Thr protein kinase) n=1 Tax=Actinokineospora auranticolor TaxID=155976 RepID=A0A2S6GIM4_9PSEU|nr:sensor histidine kinase [Actinokineospora auranticolor]PPK65069.1 anti-sigma regulatory factor (Ser/Thr protein kinase) [Actinokineospora auranticolor]